MRSGVSAASRASSPGYRPTPRSQARRNIVTSLCLTLVQVYGQRRHQDPWRRENSQGEGGIVADGGKADGRQGSEHHGESGAVEPGPAPAPLGGEPHRDHQVRRDEEKSASTT